MKFASTETKQGALRIPGCNVSGVVQRLAASPARLHPGPLLQGRVHTPDLFPYLVARGI